MLQTNRSTFGLGPANVVLQVPTLAPGTTSRVMVPMTVDVSKIVPGAANSKLEVREARQRSRAGQAMPMGGQ